MNTVKALFFARYRDLIGEREVDLPVSGPISVGELVRTLRSRGAPYSELPADPAVAVNRRVADADTPVEPGDEVAFLPPVAGG